jgi:hypothetical protein
VEKTRKNQFTHLKEQTQATFIRNGMGTLLNSVKNDRTWHTYCIRSLYTSSTQGGATTDDRVGSRAKREEPGVSEAGACVRRPGGGGAAGAGRTSPISSWRRLYRGNLDDGRTEA